MAGEKNKLDLFFKELGKQIKHFRKENGFSLEELGLQIGLDRSAMHRIENGYHITVTTVIKLCMALDKEPKDFFEFDFNFKKEELGSIIKSKKSPKKASPSKRKTISSRK